MGYSQGLHLWDRVKDSKKWGRVKDSKKCGRVKDSIDENIAPKI